MPSFLPSEIGRLIYGYLLTECGEDLADEFLNSCDDLRECRAQKQQGLKFHATVQDLTLTAILNQYSILSSMIFANTTDEDRVHRNLLNLLQNLLKSKLGASVRSTESNSTCCTPVSSIVHEVTPKTVEAAARPSIEVGVQCSDEFTDSNKKQNDNSYCDASTLTDELLVSHELKSVTTLSTDSFQSSNNLICNNDRSVELPSHISDSQESNISESAASLNNAYVCSKSEDSIDSRDASVMNIVQASISDQKSVDSRNTESWNNTIQTSKNQESTSSENVSSMSHMLQASVDSFQLMKSCDFISTDTEDQDVNLKDSTATTASTQASVNDGDSLKTSDTSLAGVEQSKIHSEESTLSINKSLRSPLTKSNNATPSKTREHTNVHDNVSDASSKTLKTPNHHPHSNKSRDRTPVKNQNEQITWENTTTTSADKNRLVVSLRRTPLKAVEPNAAYSEKESGSRKTTPFKAADQPLTFPELFSSDSTVPPMQESLNRKRTPMKDTALVFREDYSTNKKLTPRKVPEQNASAVIRDLTSSSIGTPRKITEQNSALLANHHIAGVDAHQKSNEVLKINPCDSVLPVLNHNYQQMVSHYRTPAKIRPKPPVEPKTTKSNLLESFVPKPSPPPPGERKSNLPWDYNLRQSLAEDVLNSVNTPKPVVKCKKNRTPGKKRKIDDSADERLECKKVKISDEPIVDLTKNDSEPLEINSQLKKTNVEEKTESTKDLCKRRAHQAKTVDVNIKKPPDVCKKRMAKNIRKPNEIKIEGKREQKSRNEVSKARDVAESSSQKSIDATIDDVIRGEVLLPDESATVDETETEVRDKRKNQNVGSNKRDINVNNVHKTDSKKRLKTKIETGPFEDEKKQEQSSLVPVDETSKSSSDILGGNVACTSNSLLERHVFPKMSNNNLEVKPTSIDTASKEEGSPRSSETIYDDENWQAHLEMTEEVVLLYKVSSNII